LRKKPIDEPNQGREIQQRMASDFIPDGEAQFNTWLQNFSTKCVANDTILDLSAPDLFEIQTDAENYTNSYVAQAAAKDALKGATAERNTNRKSATAMARAYAKRFKSNPAVSDQLLGELGILSSSTSGPVVTVTALDVMGCDNGVNKLTWDRNGNATGTTFIIEFSKNGGTTWSFAGAVSKVTFSHEGQAPGQTTWYRVISNRASTSSAPTAPVVAYPSGGETTLTLAA
jgi:hypothetical protein